MKITSDVPQNQIIKVEANACAGLACDSTIRLRLDVKGSPALRFLNHQLYKTLDAYTGCCDANNAAIDHTVALLKWADKINEALVSDTEIHSTLQGSPDSSTTEA